jgi:hypothetical protein
MSRSGSSAPPQQSLDDRPLARLGQPIPIKPPEIPRTLPGEPSPESIAPKRVGPVSPSLNVAPSASVRTGETPATARSSLPRPR